jgi:hypothetical protein
MNTLNTWMPCCVPLMKRLTKSPPSPNCSSFSTDYVVSTTCFYVDKISDFNSSDFCAATTIISQRHVKTISIRTKIYAPNSSRPTPPSSTPPLPIRRRSSYPFFLLFRFITRFLPHHRNSTRCPSHHLHDLSPSSHSPHHLTTES